MTRKQALNNLYAFEHKARSLEETSNIEYERTKQMEEFEVARLWRKLADYISLQMELLKGDITKDEEN